MSGFRYRGGHGALYSEGLVADGDHSTITWLGEVYIPAACGMAPLLHTFTISGAHDRAGTFDVMDTVVSLPDPSGDFVPAITGRCERR